jgi:anti-anti-sigma factor
MTVHAITEVRVADGRTREALWATARLGRRLREQAGFRGLWVFRSETDPRAVLVLTEWAGWDEAAAAQAAPLVATEMERARALCTAWESRSLAPLFHLQLPRRGGSAGIAQTLHVGAVDITAATARHRELGLQCMTLPGTLGVLGAHCLGDPHFFFCAAEFESNAALIDFIQSSVQREWSGLGTGAWWCKEPRLEIRGDLPNRRRGTIEQPAASVGSLSIRVESSQDGGTVVLRLRGHLDEAAAERLGQVRDAITAQGCRELTLDVSDLVTVTRDGLQILLATARRVKESGGRFTLVDNQGRFNRILRVFHLNRVLGLGREKGARKPVHLRLPGPWKLPS